MHEWSLAEAIVDSLIPVILREGAKRVSEVEIVYGEMMELELDILRFALEELSKGTPLEGSKFVFKEEEASFRCNSCGHRWNFKQVHDSLPEDLGIREGENGERESPIHFIPELAQALMRCPNCGSRDFEVESGKGLSVRRLVLEG
ncbi:MAG: hydrogenase nickel insertion protein HypA [Candidatus Korarchaeota archaeon NZ13-K]|nr:MAG: hydrogenase nickel insertion protein HypA [Candidatus Korarchaeota archaeon NZ13-K]